jgi:2-iminobutanoate/2-iminopropanoate deaminase
LSGFPPFDPKTGEVVDALKCNAYCTSVEKFGVVDEIYARYFPKKLPARIFVNVPAWPGHFDIGIDCVAAL